ncbi:MAG: 5-methyltetrahydropteroyltriglutamate--homocysteine S-methyltransferase [Dermabacter sp.]|nr:5-methyltetrahydropteroyltriglutamate--homocysteine S-methyltransferase [Dermabacter sp.]
MTATIVGYPRIGRRRELKSLVEKFWAGKVESAALIAGAHDLREATAQHLSALGLERSEVPETFSLYDQVLDTLATLGAVPTRFAAEVRADAASDAAEVALTGGIGIDGYFALARGSAAQPPLEMTKWFDTNYHYLVPEIGPDTALSPAPGRLVELARGGSRPVLVGPLTFLLLSRPDAGAPEGFDPLDRLDDVVAAYAVLLTALAEAGVSSVQLDEPALATDTRVGAERVNALIAEAYPRLSSLLPLLVTTPYGDARAHVGALAQAGVQAIHLDLHRGALPTAADFTGLGGARVVAGIIDGRGVWKANLDVATARLLAVRAAVVEAGGAPEQVSVSTAVSLQHTPHTIADEAHLNPELLATLAFADEKVREVVALAEAGQGLGADAEVDSQLAAAPLSVPRTFEGVVNESVRERAAALRPEDSVRTEYGVRDAAQRESLHLPPIPTTTIGSFPQTDEVRAARREVRTGKISEEQYVEAIRAEIERVIRLQERIGLDVLVHGEAERNDMVQYFGENLDGFAITKHGWVQSYGSRCTRPSILFGDVSRPAPITVPWSSYAASLTDAPVKGMLTGPVTILAWSFVRDDQPLEDTANHVALALRDEISDLEAAGIGIIQVDEPALRELLPLTKAAQEAYLEWSTRAFRLATAGAAPATQIHTHLCYSEFNEVIDAINDLDADVTTIESARSHGDIIRALDPERFTRQIGPGVWDIHSPRVPSVEAIEEQLEVAVGVVGAERLWANPDCGLKTRGYAETEASLENLVQATRKVREAHSL